MKRLNQSILKEINLEYSLDETDAEAQTSVLWLPDAELTHWEKTLMLAKTESK